MYSHAYSVGTFYVHILHVLKYHYKVVSQIKAAVHFDSEWTDIVISKERFLCHIVKTVKYLAVTVSFKTEHC